MVTRKWTGALVLILSLNFITPSHYALAQGTLLSQVESLLTMAKYQKSLVSNKCAMQGVAATVESALIPLTLGFILFDLVGYKKHDNSGKVSGKYKSRYRKVHESRLESATHDFGIAELERARFLLKTVEKLYINLDLLVKDQRDPRYVVSMTSKEYRVIAQLRSIDESFVDTVKRLHKINIDGVEALDRDGAETYKASYRIILDLMKKQNQGCQKVPSPDLVSGEQPLEIKD